jgi:MEDS: MEthanogen/methylotroph, DcmR Sensory domain
MLPENDSDHPSEQISADPGEPIRIAGTTLGEYPHICAFFHAPEEEYRVLLPFIKEGFERGEKAFHVVDPKQRDDHVRRIESAGIDMSDVEENGQFELRNWDEVYIRDGHFDQNRLLVLVPAVLEDAKQRGFRLTHLVTHMEWSLEDRPGVNDLVEFEARLNLLPRFRDPVVCVYDLAKFGADVVIDVMCTHPMIIIGGILQENPFFVPPDEFLRELRERGSGANVTLARER